ncbi:hypothetical protein MTR67_036183, partial [Solanum verrucosum]
PQQVQVFFQIQWNPQKTEEEQWWRSNRHHLRHQHLPKISPSTAPEPTKLPAPVLFSMTLYSSPYQISSSSSKYQAPQIHWNFSPSQTLLPFCYSPSFQPSKPNKSSSIFGLGKFLIDKWGDNTSEREEIE